MNGPTRITIRAFGGGGRMLAFFAGAGVVGLIATIIGFAVDPRQSLFSYLNAFVYFLSITLGALVWLHAFQATGARWIVVLRRLLEVMSTGMLVYVVLFIPVVFGIRILYPWAAPDTAPDFLRGPDFAQLMAHKHVYLNVPFFELRALIYFALWACLGTVLYWLSRQQDERTDFMPTIRARRFGAVTIPILGLSIAFAAFDWIMALQPTWYSTIFGVYYFAGGFMAAMAVLILCTRAAESYGVLPPGLVTRSHYHSMGKLMFAFICFHAYIGFSQYMLIWIGNLPDEISYFKLRRDFGYFPVFIFLILFHFVVPFLILLSKDLKRQPARLSMMAIWMLFMHWVDSYWMVMPYRGPNPIVHWQDLTAFVGVGGTVIATALLRLRGALPVPAGDPYLPESVAYERG